jgi:hypothetical protein
MEKYPMSLYKDADRNADHRIVADQEQERPTPRAPRASA